jgi:hypothetical protein
MEHKFHYFMLSLKYDIYHKHIINIISDFFHVYKFDFKVPITFLIFTSIKLGICNALHSH